MAFDETLLGIGADPQGIIISSSGGVLSLVIGSDSTQTLVTPGPNAGRIATYYVSPDGDVGVLVAPSPLQQAAYVSSGLLTFSGAAGISAQRKSIFSGSGLLTFSGAAAVLRSVCPSGYGLLTFSGAASVVITAIHPGAGVLTFSGSAIQQQGSAFTSSPVAVTVCAPLATPDKDSLVVDLQGRLLSGCCYTGDDLLILGAGGPPLTPGLSVDGDLMGLAPRAASLQLTGQADTKSYRLAVFVGSGGVDFSGAAASGRGSINQSSGGISFSGAFVQARRARVLSAVNIGFAGDCNQTFFELRELLEREGRRGAVAEVSMRYGAAPQRVERVAVVGGKEMRDGMVDPENRVASAGRREQRAVTSSRECREHPVEPPLRSGVSARPSRVALASAA